MNDIAAASDRGRRTIYTYFATKKEIFEAVVQSSADDAIAQLRQAVNAETTAEQKLRRLIEFRIDLVHNYRANTDIWIKAIINRDVDRANRIRTIIRDETLKMIDEIIAQGVEAGEFDPKRSRHVPRLLTVIVQGNDMNYVSNHNHLPSMERPSETPAMRSCTEFIIESITTKP